MKQDRSVSKLIRALAFDVDGTIADTDPIHAEAWSRALEAINGRSFSISEYLEACINGAMTPQDFISPLCDPAEWSKIEAEKRNIYPGLLSVRASLTVGLVEFLGAARSYGVAVAIVSSSSRESVDALLNGPWRSPPPDVIVARGDTTSAKPDPAPYLAAVRLLKVPAVSVAAFEDSRSGVRAATAAGLTCVQVGLASDALTQLRVKDFRSCEITCHDGCPCLTVHQI